MDRQELKRRAHDLDVTVWVGKGGPEAVVDELNDQLANENLVKVKFLRAARAGGSTEEKARELAEAVNADLIETRGHTAVVHR
ncbi:YhbY family RNA-binding protein [Natrononativus amylolyticus]|uniref:YhbY family RNA-binding protein n=1 Tax=Natrononativus amylolyticus TaxID=2963434 RepID=UPI0020CEC5C0|nr:YhbY family RNA-binding protein [Natrononativus amylolyticus]